MNYIPIHTNIAPNYNYLSAENAYLKQSIEYKDAVLEEQQITIQKLQKDVTQLSEATMDLKIQRDKAIADAERWRVMQQIIRTQGNDQQAYLVGKVVDKDLERGRAARVERRSGCSAGATPYPSSSPNR